MNKGIKIALILVGATAVGGGLYWLYKSYSADSDSMRKSDENGDVQAGTGKNTTGAGKNTTGAGGRRDGVVREVPRLDPSMKNAVSKDSLKNLGNLSDLQGKLIKGLGVIPTKQTSIVNNNADYMGQVPAGKIIGVATGETRMAKGVSQMETMIQVQMFPGTKDWTGKIISALPKMIWVNRNHVNLS